MLGLRLSCSGNLLPERGTKSDSPLGRERLGPCRFIEAGIASPSSLTQRRRCATRTSTQRCTPSTDHSAMPVRPTNSSAPRGRCGRLPASTCVHFGCSDALSRSTPAATARRDGHIHGLSRRRVVPADSGTCRDRRARRLRFAIVWLAKGWLLGSSTSTRPIQRTGSGTSRTDGFRSPHQRTRMDSARSTTRYAGSRSSVLRTGCPISKRRSTPLTNALWSWSTTSGSWPPADTPPSNSTWPTSTTSLICAMRTS